MENTKENYAIVLWHNEKILQIRTLNAPYQYVLHQAQYIKSVPGTQITDVSINKTVEHAVRQEDLESDLI